LTRLAKKSKSRLICGFLLSAIFLLFLISSNQSLGIQNVVDNLYVHGSQQSVSLVGAVWVSGGAIPGDKSALLNVTVQNLNSVPIFGIQEKFDLSSSVLRNSTGGFTASSVVQGTIQPGALGSAVFKLNLPLGENYAGLIYVPLTVSFENSTISNVQSLSVPVSVDQPLPLSIERTGWSGNSNGTELALGSGGAQGDLSDFLVIQLLNPNSFSVHSLTATVSYNSHDMYNSTGGNSSSYSFSSPAVVMPNSLATLSFPVNISPNATMGQVPIAVSLNYEDPWFTPLNQSTKTQIVIYGSPTVSLKEISTIIRAGQTSTVSFEVTNIGTSPMYSPLLSLQLRTGLIVTGNSTSPARNPTINPGASTIFSFDITTANTFLVGAYHATALIFYNNQFGLRERAAFSLSILIAGTISLSFQNLQLVQNYNNITVLANVINYGNSASNLTKVNAYLSTVANGTKHSTQLASASSYIGTISPRAPSYFTLILPYVSQNVPMNVNLTIVLSYQNGSGVALQSTNTTIFGLLPSSQLVQPPGSSQLVTIGIGVVIVVAIAILFSILYLRRKNLSFLR
jgi:hypothetical protein